MIKNKLKKIHKLMHYNCGPDRDKLALSFFGGKKPILDVACGVGNFIKLDSDRINGIDWSPVSVKQCQEEGLNVSEANALDLPYDDNTIDNIHCCHLIEHLTPENAHTLLFELARVLKVGGTLVLRGPTMHEKFYDDLTHVRPYNPNAILHYYQSAGVQRTLESIPYEFKVIKKVWRYAEFPIPRLLNFYIISNILYRFGIHGSGHTGFILVLEKERWRA